MLKDDEIKYCRNMLDEYSSCHLKISYILVSNNNDQPKHYRIIAYDPVNNDEMYGLDINGDHTAYYSIPEYDFNIEDYLLDDLENGYELGYASLEEHYNFWYAIDQLKDEIEHDDGLQNYLKYCQRNDITPKSIELLGFNKVDITPLYNESIGSYKIIAESSINKETIVLAHSDTAPSPYVTWWTTPNRQYGYESGHYFTKFNEAYSNFKKRSHDLLDNQINRNKNNIKPDKGVER